MLSMHAGNCGIFPQFGQLELIDVLLQFNLLYALRGPVRGAIGGAAAFGFVGRCESWASHLRIAVYRDFELRRLTVSGAAARDHQQG